MEAPVIGLSVAAAALVVGGFSAVLAGSFVAARKEWMATWRGHRILIRNYITREELYIDGAQVQQTHGMVGATLTGTLAARTEVAETTGRTRRDASPRRPASARAAVTAGERVNVSDTWPIPAILRSGVLPAMLAVGGTGALSCANRIETEDIEAFGRVRSAVWFEQTVESQIAVGYDHTSHVFYASNQPGLCEALQEAAAVVQRYSDEWFDDVQTQEVETQCDWWVGYLGELDEALGTHMGADARLFGAAYYEPVCVRPSWPPEGTFGPACTGDPAGGFRGR